MCYQLKTCFASLALDLTNPNCTTFKDGLKFLIENTEELYYAANTKAGASCSKLC